MALRKPLVLNSGKIQQIQSGDILDSAIIETEAITATNGESSDAITVGMAVYLSAADTVKKAKADAAGTTEVFGLCYSASVAASDPGEFRTSGQLSSADWTAVVGSTTLSAGSFYYLDASTAGKLTATPPGSGYIVEVGQAINTTTMQIRTRQAIKL